MTFGRLLVILALVPGGRAAAQESARGSDPSAYHVGWDSPSADSSGSMPLGNGDVSLNAWVEPSGDLLFYVGKTDSWGDNGRLLKVGRVRVRVSPSPLAENTEFTQELALASGEIRVSVHTPASVAAEGREMQLAIWVDAHRPVIHVEIEDTAESEVTAILEPWRTEAETLPSIEVSDVMLDRSRPDQQRAPTVVEPDVLLDEEGPRIGWYHHNSKSVGPALTMEIQGLADCLGEDPLLHRTFGAVVTGSGARRVDERTLVLTEPGTRRLTVHVLTLHPSTPKEWRVAMDALIAAAGRIPFEEQHAAHERWWKEFWGRSYLHVREDSPRPRSLIPASDHPLLIGADQGGGNLFRGSLGRVSLLGEVLEPEDIAALAAGGRTALGEAPRVLWSDTDVEPGRVLAKGEEGEIRGSLTLEAWVRCEELPAGGGRILDQITPGGSDGFLLDTWPGNSLRLIAGTAVLENRDGLTVGEWHHVAATCDPGRGRLALYLDGAEVAATTADAASDAFTVSRAYALQRFVNACAGRGRYPIKFNGSIFTVPYPGRPGDADYRRWGPGYWWQNTRLPYLSMCTSGDFDLMEPLFRMYTEEILPVALERTRRTFGHGGAFLSECVYFWGAVFSETYGWTPFDEREDKLQASGWHKWEWVAGPELVWMMLDHHEHTADGEFLRTRLLPTARAVLTFFHEHYSDDERGKMVLHPSQALETWWDCTDPMPEVAGLQAVTERLLALPATAVPAADRTLWQTLRARVPELPTREIDGVRMLAPARLFADKRNVENPELYAVFPFRRVALGRGDLDLALEALRRRPDRGSFGWRQDDVFMAYLGLADEARDFLVGRARNKDPRSRFPAFWGPNYDWIPDQDHGGILLKALQAMLLQTDGTEILLLPAWPAGWDASFRLHAPGRTVLTGEVKAGRLVALEVDPPKRRKDVRIGSERAPWQPR